MYQVHLDDAGRQELQRRTHEPGVMPRTRDRLEMIRLSDAGWSVPRIAKHFGLSERCVRIWVKAYLSGGFDALPDQTHVGQQSSLTPTLIEAVRSQITQGGRTWNAPQIAEWLAQNHSLHLSSPWLGRLLHRSGFSYQRTSRSLHHKQDPEQVAEKTAQLQALEKKGTPD
jgi:transposase